MSFSQGDSDGSSSSVVMDITKYDETPIISSKVRGRRKTKSLSWKKKNQDEEDDEGEIATQECLLPQENVVIFKAPKIFLSILSFFFFLRRICDIN